MPHKLSTFSGPPPDGGAQRKIVRDASKEPQADEVVVTRGGSHRTFFLLRLLIYMMSVFHHDDGVFMMVPSALSRIGHFGRGQLIVPHAVFFVEYLFFCLALLAVGLLSDPNY